MAVSMNQYEVAIEAARQTNNVSEGSNFAVYPKVSSTMDMAEAAIRDGARDRFTVIALEQSGGVGSTDAATGKPRVWNSPIGHLYMSMVVELKGDEHGEQIEMLAAFAAGEVARRTIADKDIRLAWHWPNDLWRMRDDGRSEKFGGVLVKPGRSPNDHNKVVVGVGINIADVLPNPRILREGSQNSGITSLHACGSAVTIGQFAQYFHGAFLSKLNLFRSYGFMSVMQEMGFACQGQIRLTDKNTGEKVSGVINGYVSKPSPEGVMADYVLIHHKNLPERCFHLRALTGISPIVL
jgi:biotin-(acetyl-CoA carboxylase) ligase